ncbi:MAG: hypothetical protein HY721_03745 [Planctomycetes bacterium]|nr:hypothetical protein [Planctomycetota bacterium]
MRSSTAAAGILVAALCLVSAALLFVPLLSHSGLAPGNDTALHVGNVVEAAHLLEHRWPPWDWLPDIAGGRGGPNYLFYGSAGFVLPGWLVKLGLSPVDGLRVLVAVGLLAGGISAFLWCSAFGGALGGATGALLFLHGPYFLSLAYSRGSYPEFLASALYPLVFFCTWRWVVQHKWSGLLGGTIAFAFIVAVHTLSLILLTPFVLGFGGLAGAAAGAPLGRSAVRATVLVAVGALLAAPYLAAPLLEVHKVAIAEQFTTSELYQASGVPWYCLLNSVPLHDHPASYALPGRAHLLAWSSAAVVLLAGIGCGSRRFLTLHVVFCGLALLLVVDATARLSGTLLPPMRYLQFPFRFLGIFNVFCASSFAAAWFTRQGRPPVPGQVLAAAVSVALPFLTLGTIPAQAGLRYSTATREGIRGSLTTLDHEDKYLPRGSRRPTAPAPEILLQVGEAGTFTPLATALNDYRYLVETRDAATAVFHQFAFDGWQATLEGKPLLLRRQKDTGLCVLDIPEGRHQVRIFFADTSLRRFSKALSLVTWSCLGLVAAWVCARRRRSRCDHLGTNATARTHDPSASLRLRGSAMR